MKKSVVPIIMILGFVGCIGNHKSDESRKLDSIKQADSLALEQTEKQRVFDSIEKSKTDSLNIINGLNKAKIIPLLDTYDENLNKSFNFKIQNKSNKQLTSIQFVLVDQELFSSYQRFGQEIFNTEIPGHNKKTYHLSLRPNESKKISFTAGFNCIPGEWVLFRYLDGTISKEQIYSPK